MNELLTVLDWLLQLAAAVAECWFLCRMNAKRVQIKNFTAYLCVWLALTAFSHILPVWTLGGWIFNQAVSLVLLCLYGKAILHLPWPPSAASASILLVLNALFSQVGALLTYLTGNHFSPLLGLLYFVAIHAGRFLVFFLLVRLLGHSYAATGNRYLYLLLVPCALFILLFADSFYTLLGEMDAMPNSALAAKACFMLSIASASFALVLYAFAKAGQYTGLQRERDMLALAIQGQMQYVEEATRRNTANRAVQHDLKNHLLVLAGLLEKQDIPAAQLYLKRLDATANPVGEGIVTGYPAVDVVMGEKLREAAQRGISVTQAVHLPAEAANAFDLCVIFANALDNALHACSMLPNGQAWIKLRASQRQQFLVLEFINAATPSPKAITESTGLQNIRRVAEKYGGTVKHSHTGSSFQLSVLLCLSEKPPVADF